MDYSEERQIMEYVTRNNIERFRALLRITTDERQRQTLSGLLASEEARLLEHQALPANGRNVPDRLQHS